MNGTGELLCVVFLIIFSTEVRVSGDEVGPLRKNS